MTRMHGRVTDADSGAAIPAAVVDIWQASTNGLYDFQDAAHQAANNLRGKFRTDDEGRYWFYCLKPTAYSLPQDGPSFRLLQMLDRHPMRPAHIHLMVSAGGYAQCVTQIFPSNDPWVTNDTVFAVKPDLVLDFLESKGDPKAQRDLTCDIRLARRSKTEGEADWSAELGK